ncbi:3-isopropylmalate dehydratase small subunit [Enterobacteriaceae endosymbiont of Macroplea appendiculata]|uniref:3-isopropylmalate dehydratase small subunit n=1 Tax=Enterobacteriaceae endosymbiont of Macroplea appendiculata TaxID=2675790 RepID=UPI00144A2730|nr:3-isopropylmalate dehydratase small subunit [Enterobacteriaceae endosymbiont of Macroplea appendiculata]QJC30678.1 3-isopropylmalate dehydratase small subunit [Enterobacteriaceae endosymbiont of Macroplea appendiculata]
MKNIQLKYIGVIAPLDISNIDTDAIIPKQFLQKNVKYGFGKYLFYYWRYINKNQVNPEFILNQQKFKNANILLTRDNFGCGSSREHALWALIDYGIKVIISSSYADIFYNNAINNKLLLITLSKKDINKLFLIIKEQPGITCVINMQDKIIIIANKYFSFHIDKYILQFILNDVDQIDITMKYYKKINIFELKHHSFFS